MVKEGTNVWVLAACAKKKKRRLKTTLIGLQKCPSTKEETALCHSVKDNKQDAERGCV